MKKKICKYCGKEFDAKCKDTKFCSHKCSSKYNWSQKEYREKTINAQTLAKNLPDARYKNSEQAKERCCTDEYKKEFKERMTKYWTPENRKKCGDKSSKRNNKPEIKKKIADKQKMRMSCDINRVQISTSLKKYFNENPDVSSRIRRKSYCKNPEIKNKISKSMLELWQNTEYANNQITAGFRYREFELPSGRIIKLQGYEPQVLEQLLQKYTEDDIVCEVKSINKEIGKILYTFENKERRYYPDFYIKSTNTIIEVKSQWFFDLYKEKNLAKEQACLTKGFNFEFIII